MGIFSILGRDSISWLIPIQAAFPQPLIEIFVQLLRKDQGLIRHHKWEQFVLLGISILF